MGRSLVFRFLVVLAHLAGPAAAAPPPRSSGAPEAPVSAEELIRAVARSQRRADLAVTASAFDQVEVKTEYGRDGRPKSVRRRRFRYASGEGPGVTRELVEVDGRPATEAERREDAEDEARDRRRRADREAARRASRPTQVRGSEDDPLVGPIRLSDLIGRFSYGPVEEVIVEGRRAWAVAFAPRPGLRPVGRLDRALGSLAGRVIVDATDFQVVSVDARLVAPVKIGGGLALNVRHATISYRAQQVADGAWLPCFVGLRVQGRTALLFRLDTAFRFEFSGYSRATVEVDAVVDPRRGR